MGIAGRDISISESYESAAKSYSSELGIAKLTPDSEAYSTSPTVLKIIIKGSNAVKLKIPFNGFLLQIPQLDTRNLSPFHVRERFYTGLPLSFSTVDIIYPFHSFW